jgi:hypothetical protein
MMGRDQARPQGARLRFMAGRQPNPRAARHRDHRRRLPFASAFISAATVGASTGPVIRIRPPVANSISITPALSATPRAVL